MDNLKNIKTHEVVAFFKATKEKILTLCHEDKVFYTVAPTNIFNWMVENTFLVGNVMIHLNFIKEPAFFPKGLLELVKQAEEIYREYAKEDYATWEATAKIGDVYSFICPILGEKGKLGDWRDYEWDKVCCYEWDSDNEKVINEVVIKGACNKHYKGHCMVQTGGMGGDVCDSVSPFRLDLTWEEVKKLLKGESWYVQLFPI